MDTDYDYTPGDDYAAASTHYAGPFCSCGDHSCPASNDPTAPCINEDRSPVNDTWCQCGINDCAAHHTDQPCTYPPEHPVHH